MRGYGPEVIAPGRAFALVSFPPRTAASRTHRARAGTARDRLT
ncbi:hypothetical protein STTU_3541 [Streptomyces sp. Tu6071]|nr:hypothetical protein STTU_3541 [Streptomyces sp. Tu6071]